MVYDCSFFKRDPEANKELESLSSDESGPALLDNPKFREFLKDHFMPGVKKVTEALKCKQCVVKALKAVKKAGCKPGVKKQYAMVSQITFVVVLSDEYVNY